MENEQPQHISSPINYDFYFENGYINYESPFCMALSAILWRAFYYSLRFIFHKQSPVFSSRIVSLTHGTIAAFMGINQCFIFDCPFDHPEWKTSYVQSFILTMSFGYFVHDTIFMWKYERNDRTMLIHHFLCILSLVRMNFKGYSGAQATCGLGSMELTNPFLQARWFLRTAGMQSMPVYVSTELTFFLIFITVRIILGSYFLVMILRQPKNDWDFVLMTIGIYVISWIFVGSMFKYIIKKYMEHTSEQKNQ